MTKRRPPKRPRKRKPVSPGTRRQPKRTKRPAPSRPKKKPARVAPKPRHRKKPVRVAPKPRHRKKPVRVAPKPRHRKKPVRVAPKPRPRKKPVRVTRKPRRHVPKQPSWLKRKLPKSASLSFVDEVRSIVEREHSVKSIDVFERTYKKTRWLAFEPNLREETPVEELAHIAKQLEKGFRKQYPRAAVRSGYRGIERDEEGEKISEGSVTLKSAVKGAFDLEKKFEFMAPTESGRFRTFRRFRFEVKLK